jgi:hypothetical protein
MKRVPAESALPEAVAELVARLRRAMRPPPPGPRDLTGAAAAATEPCSCGLGDPPDHGSPVIVGVNRSHRRLATAKDPLHKRGLWGALAAPGLRHAGHHLVDMLAAARPRRVTAPAACHLSTHRAFLLKG